MKIDEFQGSNIVDTPELPGIYAWYYRPHTFGENVSEIMGKLIKHPARVKTEIALRYRLMWAIDSDFEVLYGAKGTPADEVVSGLVTNSGDLTKTFIQNVMVPHFAKPLYIGKSNNLFRRIYKEHYLSLAQLWDMDASVSQYLASHPDAAVEEVLEKLGLKHSFAIEARVKRIATRDLVVCVCTFENLVELRNLEQILQILADPICGKE